MLSNLIPILTAALLLLTATNAMAEATYEDRPGGAKLVGASIVDEYTVALHFLDGEVIRSDDGQGEDAFMGHESHGDDLIVSYVPPLNLEAAAAKTSFKVYDIEKDQNILPYNVFRKSKVSGVPGVWPEPPATMGHTIFLDLAGALEAGVTYEVRIDDAVNSSESAIKLTYSPEENHSDAIKVNLVGYDATQTAMKSADLYHWLGDGGAKDYSDYEGNAVQLRDVETGEMHDAGTVKFHAKRGKDHGGWDLVGSDVWTCDFSDFTGEGTFQIVIDGIGASRPFEIRSNIYENPFGLSMLGFYYMRIGEPMEDGHSVMSEQLPPPRQPRFIPEGNDAGIPADPPGYRVVRTTMSPNHPDWKTLGGDPWDRKDWSKYVEEGSPTNPNAWGGHSDALDWDRRFQQMNCVFDLLLPYVLLGERLNHDDTGIAESGNGIPDLLDSAENEAAYWRRVRDGEGNFSFGVNNPTIDQAIAYQAAAAPWMAHANAAMAAMMADCFRIAGREEEMQSYLETALDAYERGGEDDLDAGHHVGNNNMRGRDLKATAAGYLYKLTGEKKYEDDFAKYLDMSQGIVAKDLYTNSWAAAAYLSCAEEKIRPINHPQLLGDLRRQAVEDARSRHQQTSASYPSRRSSDGRFGWFQTVIEVSPLLLAHRYGDFSSEERDELLGLLLLEADYSLGRNALNQPLMTGHPDIPFTGINGDRYIKEAYTSGRNDGFPGVHPGHTPYMNEKQWGNGFMADPGWMSSKGYPKWAEWQGDESMEENQDTIWPHGEALWNNWYSYCNNEFTPQQSMAAKTGMYAYLYGALRSE